MNPVLKKLADFWWPLGLMAIVSYCFLWAASDELQRFISSQSGWRGFLIGFLHGLSLDLGHVGRVDAAQDRLVSWVVFWQNLFRIFFLLALVASAVRLRNLVIARKNQQPTPS